MNFIKKSLFILSLIALYLSIKIGVKTEDCGGTYTNLSGTISSPNYPSNYSNNLNCFYFIKVPFGNSSVNITFISFDTDPCCDSLLIICASSRDPPKAVPRLYGKNAPPFLSLSLCYSVQLVFYTDGSVVRQGFSLSYAIGMGIQGGITMKPMNVYVRNNSIEPIVLSCSSRANLPDAYPWWSCETDEYYYSFITAPNCSVLSSLDYSHPVCISTSRQDSIATCNLTISPSYTNVTAGICYCTDITLDYAVALVTYIGPSFISVDLNSSETEVVQGDQISVICSVQISTTTTKYLQLTQFVYIYSDDNQRPIAVSNTTATITVSAPMEVLPSYVCNINFTFSSSSVPWRYATNRPQNISLVIRSRPVLYPPDSTKMSIIGDDSGRVVANGILTCFVPANPPVTYQWINEGNGLKWNGSTLTVSNNGSYTCSATNIIRGNTHKASKLISVTIGIIGLQGGLTTKPINVYVHNNSTEPIVLSCSSRYNQIDVYPVWSFSTDGYSFTNITTTSCSVFSSQYNSTYFNTTKQYSPRTCNLTISPSFVTTAVGVYTCTDATLDYASALVVYLITSITGSLLSSATTEVVQNDQFTFGCSVQVVQATSSYLPIIPTLYIYSVEDQRLIISSNTTASIIVSASPESLPSYACDINYTLAGYFPTGYATNMPVKTSLVTPSRQVLYWPENSRMSIQGDNNGRVVANGILTCFVPANPPVTYQWTNEETKRLWNGSTVTVSNNGTYTCNATNVIRGKSYEASKSISVTITINDTQNDKSLIIAVVVLGIAVLLLVVAIVVSVLLWRKKHSATTDTNYDYIDDATRTDSDLGDPHVYQLTQQESLNVDQGETVATSGHNIVAPMYDRITFQTYDTEIYSEDKRHLYRALDE